MEKLINHPDFDALHERGYEGRPVTCFDRYRNETGLEGVPYTAQDCDEMKRLVIDALPEFEIVTTWNGEGFTRFSVSLKLRAMRNKEL